MKKEAPEWDKVVKDAEGKYLLALFDDMMQKQRKFQQAKGYKKDEYYIEYISAQRAYWIECDRLSFGKDHEAIATAWWKQLSELDTQEIDVSKLLPPGSNREDNDFFDPDRDDNDWMRE